MCVPSVRLRKPGCAGFSAIRTPKVFNPLVEDDHPSNMAYGETDQASYPATIKLTQIIHPEEGLQS
jgi:hypothetical protein